MNSQLERSVSKYYPPDLLDEHLAKHVSLIKHKAALLHKMLLYKPTVADMLNVGSRNLKVVPFYAPRMNGRGYRQVPRLLLQGMWLRKIGFEIDDYARIITLPKLLVISCANLEYKECIEPPKPVYILR